MLKTIADKLRYWADRAYGQRIGVGAIVQNPQHPAADRFREICYEQADRLDFGKFA